MNIHEDGSISLVADKRLYTRAMVKEAAAIVVEQAHVLLDLDSKGNTTVKLSALAGDVEALKNAAGLFGNLLVSELARRKMDAQTMSSRNLLLARALDGALPKEARLPEPTIDEKTSTSGVLSEVPNED